MRRVNAAFLSGCESQERPNTIAKFTRTYLKITKCTKSRIIGHVLRLSDQHWERIREHFPEERIPPSRPDRKPIPTRKILDAVLWILNTGAQWHLLPHCYTNYKTVHHRF